MFVDALTGTCLAELNVTGRIVIALLAELSL